MSLTLFQDGGCRRRDAPRSDILTYLPFYLYTELLQNGTYFKRVGLRK